MKQASTVRNVLAKSLEVPSTSTAHVKIFLEPPTPSNKQMKIFDNFAESDIDTSVFSHSKGISFTPKKRREVKHFMTVFKITMLVLAWCICSYSLMANNEKVQDVHQISIPSGRISSYIIFKKPTVNKLSIKLKGALLPSYYGNLSSEILDVWIQLMVMKEGPSNTSKIRQSDIIMLQNISEVWNIPIVSEQLIGQVPEILYENIFNLSSHKVDNVSYHLFRIQFKTNLKSNFPISMGFNLQPINPDSGIVYAALVLVGLYILIIFDIVHRTLAAMLASTMSLAILATFNERPSMREIISWIDIETLMLLFSMMILVTIFSETGIFDYTAVFAYKTTNGKLWPLINTLCLLTAALSCFLDNVTTALLITPITIRLCEVMKINPRQILMYTLIFANIGGAITPIGDPPNVIIASNPDVVKAGVNFGVFTLHMGIGVLLASLVAYLQIRIIYRDVNYYRFDEPLEVRAENVDGKLEPTWFVGNKLPEAYEDIVITPDILRDTLDSDLKNEIAVWERTGASVSSYSKGEETVKESLMKQTLKLQHKLKQAVSNASISEEDYQTTLEELVAKYPIKNKSLLIKSGITLFLVVFVFFLHSFPALGRLGLGWTALLGALLLFLLYDNQDLEGIFARVEWSTLLFFASLFILMEALSRLGLISWIGKQTQYIITSVGPESRLATAIVLILWVSVFASAFVDNLPLTTMMVRIAANLSNDSELNLPLQPLIWSLSFGACLGGNGSLFGSSSNIVCAGLAEQHGYRFSFIQFMKLGVPITISSTVVVTMYLIVCHVILGWHHE